MANPLSTYLSNRLIKPRVEAEVSKALSDKQPYAFGVGMVKETSLRDAIGQPHDANFSLLYSLYKLNTDVSGCVHQWAGGITSPGWRISLMDDELEATPAQVVEMKEITAWLKNPGTKLFQAMLYEAVQHLAITGDCFFYKLLGADGKPIELWPMHPALTRVVCTKAGEVLGYVMQAPGGEKVIFEAEEVLHIRLPNPTNDISGESPLELVIEEAGIDLQALRSNKAIFANGLNPSAVLLMDETAKTEDAKAMTDQLKQSHTGSDNQHKVIALSKIKSFQPWTMTYRDLEYMKLRDLATSKVTTAFRLPKLILGHHNTGDKSTARILLRNTYDNVYRPIQQLMSEVFTEGLIHLFSDAYKFEMLPPDASDPDDIRRDQMQAKRDGILTADEVRQDSFNKDALAEEDAQDESQDDEESPKAEVIEEETGKSITKATQDSREADPIAVERAELMESLGDDLVEPLSNFFTDQENEYLSALPEDLTSSSLDTYISAGKEAFDAALSLLLASLLYPTLMAGVGAAKGQVTASVSSGEVQASIDAAINTNRTHQIVQGYANTQSFKQVTNINNTTRAALRVELAEGIRLGEGVDALSERIAKVFKTARNVRSDMIAQTEVAQAYGYANYQTLAELYAQGIVKYRKWLTAPDDRVCELCLPLDGVTIPFAENYPDDYEPGHVHPRDRCTEIGLVEETD